MFRFARPALALLIYLTAHSAAAGPVTFPDASFAWRLTFGGQRVETGYNLALSHAAGDLAGTRLAELDISDRAAVVRIAALPFLARDHHVAQADSLPAPEAARDMPWYSRRWVWWTAGSLAAMAAVAGSRGDEEATGSTTINGGPSACALSGGNVGPQEIPDACVSGEDVPDDPSSGFTARLPIADRSASLENFSWLDAGTGHMGDLFPR